MSGSLLQLRNYGAEDKYIYDPYCTECIFKTKVNRCNNFSIELIEETLNTPTNFGEQFSTDITSGPDLLSKLYLRIDLPQVNLTSTTGGYPCLGRYIDNLGEFILDYIEIEINGQTLDRQHGRFMHMFNQISIPESKRELYNRMIGNVDILCKPPNMTTSTLNYTIPSYSLRIPLSFWFCRNIGSSIPLCALNHVPVKISGKLRPFEQVFISCPNVIVNVLGKPNVRIFSECVFLSQNENARFTNSKLSYLIEQVQYNGDYHIMRTPETTVPLNFSKPIKYILFAAQKSLYTLPKTLENTSVTFSNVCNQWNNFQVTAYNAYNNNWDPNGVTNSCTNCGNTYGNLITNARFRVGGIDRTMDLSNGYYSDLVPYYYFNNAPKSNGILVYTFAIDPLNLQPSGTANFTRLNNVQLNLSLAMSVPSIFANGENNTVVPTTVSTQGYCKSENYNVSFVSPPGNSDFIDIFVYAVNYEFVTFNNGICSIGYYNIGAETSLC